MAPPTDTERTHMQTDEQTALLSFHKSVSFILVRPCIKVKVHFRWSWLTR